MKMRKGPLLILFTMFMGLLVTAPNFGAMGWEAGDEEEIFGHTFEESSWYTTVENTTSENRTAEFGISFVNLGDIEAFLITLNQVEDDQGDRGVLPYQMFGMHYYTDGGKEVFIGALLAFLCVFEDSNNDSRPDAGEKFFYVVPFGVGNVLNGTYPPTVTNHEVEKVSETHYRMGITYRNMYAIATENPIATAYLVTGWVLQFSELTVTYDIEVNPTTGELTAETYYTIGQVTSLYAVILGIPIPADDVHDTIPDNFALGAVHFTTVFTSNYHVLDRNGNTLNTNRDQIINGTIDLAVDDTRAFSVGFRGDFELYDEDSNTTLSSGNPATNMLMRAKLNDLILVGWQLGFSARVFAAMAYGLSSQIRSNWETPGLLVNDSTKAVGAKGFGSQAFWYGVFFPHFDGYRVIHDPTYTAYFGEAPENPSPEPIDERTPGFGIALIAAAVPVVMLILGRRRK